MLLNATTTTSSALVIILIHCRHVRRQDKRHDNLTKFRKLKQLTVNMKHFKERTQEVESKTMQQQSTWK